MQDVAVELRSLFFAEPPWGTISSVVVDAKAETLLMGTLDTDDSPTMPPADAETDALLQANLAGKLSVADWHEWVREYPTDLQLELLDKASVVLPTDTALLFAISNLRKQRFTERNSAIPHAMGSAEDLELRRARNRWHESLRTLEALEEGRRSPSVRQNLGSVLQMKMRYEEAGAHFAASLELQGLTMDAGPQRNLTEDERRDARLALAGLDSVLAHQEKARDAGHRLGVSLGFWSRLDQRPPTYNPGLIACPFHRGAGYKRLIAPLERAAPAMRREMIALLRRRAAGEREEAVQWYSDNENIAARPEQWLRRHVGCQRSHTGATLDAPQTCQAVERAMKWFFGAVTPDGQDTVVVPPFHLKAQFSILAPGAHVTPHCGPTNERLAISVGLAGLGDAEIRVGSTWRRWRTGRATVFDDSFEHEVRNPGEYPRAVMIIHIVHPQLMARGSNGHALAANMNHYCEGLG